MGIITAIAATVSVVGAVGQHQQAKKASAEQRKMANVANARERKKSLSAMRLARARTEAMGVSSGTMGSSSQEGAMASTTANAASAIGYQFQQLNSMDKVSKYNDAASGFGLLQTAGMFAMQNPELMKDGAGKVKSLFDTKA